MTDPKPTASTTPTSSASGVNPASVPDPKSAGNTSAATTPIGATPPTVIIPEEARKKYPDLVELILKSESMNDEERNYWLQVLPVMTDDQVKELRDILETEKKKLAAIDAKYSANNAEAKPANIDVAAVEEKRRQAREARKNAEQKSQVEEKAKEADILSELAKL